MNLLLNKEIKRALLFTALYIKNFFKNHILKKKVSELSDCRVASGNDCSVRLIFRFVLADRRKS